MRRSLALLSAATIARLLAADAALAADPACTVAEQRGAVQLVRAGMPAAIAAIGDGLSSADMVRTGTDARVSLDCRGGLRVVVGPASEVRIDRYVAAEDGSSLDAALAMAFGIVRLITGETRPGRSIAVETRAAVASVRSTEWLVEATATGTAVLSVERRVQVRGAGVTVTLDPGFGTDVRQGEAPLAPRRWPDARRDAALARTTL